MEAVQHSADVPADSTGIHGAPSSASGEPGGRGWVSPALGDSCRSGASRRLPVLALSTFSPWPNDLPGLAHRMSGAKTCGAHGLGSPALARCSGGDNRRSGERRRLPTLPLGSLGPGHKELPGLAGRASGAKPCNGMAALPALPPEGQAMRGLIRLSCEAKGCQCAVGGCRAASTLGWQAAQMAAASPDPIGTATLAVAEPL